MHVLCILNKQQFVFQELEYIMLQKKVDTLNEVIKTNEENKYVCAVGNISVAIRVVHQGINHVKPFFQTSL